LWDLLLFGFHAAIKVSLFSHRIGHSNEFLKLGIELTHSLKPKDMQVISRRKRFNASKVRTRVSLRQYQMTIHPGLLWHERGKRHAYLERDAGFLRQNSHWSTLSDHDHEGVVEFSNVRGLSSKVVDQV
jgi:hypothetical protein